MTCVSSHLCEGHGAVSLFLVASTRHWHAALPDLALAHAAQRNSSSSRHRSSQHSASSPRGRGACHTATLGVGTTRSSGRARSWGRGGRGGHCWSLGGRSHGRSQGLAQIDRGRGRERLLGRNGGQGREWRWCTGDLRDW